MRITGGRVFTGESFAAGTVEVRGDRIAHVELEGAAGAAPADAACADTVSADDAAGGEAEANACAAGTAPADLDASGCYVVPGFIDLHVHGALGADLCDGTVEAIQTLMRYEASCGVTALCPTTMTFPESVLEPVMDAARVFEPARDEATLLGINMEGPFISPDKVGAQNPDYVQRCDAAMIRRLQERAGGLIKLVDIAPERDGALEFVRAMHDEVRISIAHTCATYADAKAAFAAGAQHVTHLCNAMPPLHHREPGVIGAAFEDAQTVELICDGKHVSPTMVRIVFTLFAGRVAVISDAMRAAGLADGDYPFGGQMVSVHDSLAWLTPDTIAGSVTNVAECVRRLVMEMDVPAAAAVRAATETPARALGAFDERGSLDAGKVADVIVLDRDFRVKHVVLRGELIK